MIQMDDFQPEAEYMDATFDGYDSVSKVIQAGDDKKWYVAEYPDSTPDDPIWVTVLSPTGMDWVRLPPDLGGGKSRIISRQNDRCPGCGFGSTVYHLDTHGLEVHSDYSMMCVAECHNCGWIWHRRRLGIDQDAEDDLPPNKKTLIERVIVALKAFIRWLTRKS